MAERAIVAVLGPDSASLLRGMCSNLMYLVQASTEEGGLVIYMFGLRVGERVGREMAKMGLADPVEGLRSVLMDLGLVDDVRVVHETPREISLRVEGSLEARKMRLVYSSSAGCNFTRGFAAGFLSEVLGETVFVEERECYSRGDPACVFVARTIVANPAVRHSVRRAIVDYLRANPGAHLRQISRDLGLSLGTLRWHIGVLERHGMIRERKKGNLTEFYLAE